MDYSIGSLADLISGTNTPNKPKIFKKPFPKKTFEDRTQQVVNREQPPRSKNTLFMEEKILEENQQKTFKNKKRRRKQSDCELSTGKYTKSEVPHKKKLKIKTVGDVTHGNINDNHGKSFITNMKKRLKSFNKQDNEKMIDGNVDVETNRMQNKHKVKLNERKVGENTNTDAKGSIDRKEVDSRTIFVGNVTVTVKKTQLLKHFGKFGKVQSVRLRCVTPAHPGISKRLAAIKKMLHPSRATLHCYITFEQREDALKALTINGAKYKGNHLRIQLCDDSTKPDTKKAIFIGNLPFDVEEDDLWATFEVCGPITSVRAIRNSTTGMGIGIGYVNFESSDSVELALQMEDVNIKNKEVRIQRCNESGKKRKEKPPVPLTVSGLDTLPPTVPAHYILMPKIWSKLVEPFGSYGEYIPVISEGQQATTLRSIVSEMGETTIIYKALKSFNEAPTRAAEFLIEALTFHIVFNISALSALPTSDRIPRQGKKSADGKTEHVEQKKFRKAPMTNVNVKNSIFQGAKSNKKKQRPKVNKGFVQKMKLSNKIAPKPQKNA